MSRRKQARPKSCKLEGMQEVGREEDCSPSAKTQVPEDVSQADVTSQAREGTPGEGDTTTPTAPSNQALSLSAENPGSGSSSSRSDGSGPLSVFRCETCSAVFDSLDHFMDHRNFVCSADTGLSWTTAEDKAEWSESDSRSSFSPSVEDNGGSPLPYHLTEDQLEYTIGISEANPFGCQFCEKAFQSLAYLRVHERVHGDQLPFKCQRCPRMFRHKRSCDRHMKLHCSDRKFACHLCDASFSRNEQLKRHLVQSHESSKRYQCPICQIGYSSAAALTAHLATHQEGNRGEGTAVGTSQGRELPCLHCGQSFTAIHLLQEHMAVHAAAIKVEKVSCDICSEVFSSQEALDAHVDCAHYSGHPMDMDTSMMLKCPMCPLSFPDTLSLCHHLMTHTTAGLAADLEAMTSSEGKELVRPSPPKKDGSRSHTPKGSASSALSVSPSTWTSQTHSMETDLSPSSGSGLSKSQALVCPYCMLDSFDTLEVLELHMQSVHSVKSTEIYTCNYCNAPYPNLYSLHDHMNVVHRNHPGIGIKYPCSLCNNQFPSIEALSKHKSLSHSYPDEPTSGTDGRRTSRCLGIDSAFCNRCSQTFSDARQLEDHMVCVHGASVDKKSSKVRGRKSSKGNKENKASSSSSKSKSSTSTRASATTSSTATSAIPDSSTPSPKPARASSTAPESITCDQCNATFYELVNFQAHMKLHLDAALAKFTCKKCGQQLGSQEQLEAHLSLHYLCLATEYGCTSCMKLFSKPDELQKHLMDIHAHHLYRCALCKEIFDSKVNIQVHFAIKHSNECKLFKCTQCSNIFRSEMEWQVHVRVNHLHLAKPYRCLFCAESFTSEMELQCHLTTHSKPFRCTMCEQAFHIEYLLDQHMQTAHADTDAKSINVSLNSSTSPALANVSIKEEADSSLTVSHQLISMISPRPSSHSSDTHKSLSPTGPQPPPSPLSVAVSSAVWKNSEAVHVCNICDSRFTQQALLAIHKAQEHGLKAVSLGGVTNSVSLGASNSLSPVGKGRSSSVSPSVVNAQSQRDKFLQQNQTLVSVLTADTSSGGITMSCAFCSQTFRNQTECDKHMKIHANSTSLKCNICDETFPSSATLAEHKLQHCKIQQGNVCFVCKLALKTEEQFYAHAQEHGHQGSLLQCIVCRQTLASVVELQMHGKHHFQLRPSFYTCCVCLKTFDSKENLVSKLNASGRTYYVCKPCYHGESPLYTCPQCSEKFASRAQLEAHAATHLPSSLSTSSALSAASALSMASALSVASSISALSAGSSLSALSTTSSLVHAPTGTMYSTGACLDKRAGLISALASASSVSSLTDGTSLSALSMGVSASPGSVQTFTCIKCQEVFSSEYEIQLHVANHMLQEGVTHECRLCTLVFDSPAKLQCHLIEHTFKYEPEMRCGVCRQVFGTASAIQAHVLEHGVVGRQHTCGQCSQRFFFSAELDNHVLIYNHSPAPSSLDSSRSARYRCRECSKVFSTATALANHRKTHERREPSIKCTLCTQTFTTVVLMQQHFLTAHTGITGDGNHSGDSNSSRGHTCSQCKQLFASLDGLQAHMKTHKAGKLSCPVCSRTFSQMKNLTLHLRSHSGDKPYQCPVCQKRFSREENMRAHMKSHTGLTPPQPLVCPLCNQSFSHRGNMIQHLKTHFTKNDEESALIQAPEDLRTTQTAVDVHQVPKTNGTKDVAAVTVTPNSHVNGADGSAESETSAEADHSAASDAERSAPKIKSEIVS